MDWVKSASEWAKAMLQHSGASPLALPVAFLLGLASAVASACCTLPVFGAIIGYAGMRESSNKRFNLLAACSFMVGTIIALIILGSVAGLIGQVAQSVLGVNAGLKMHQICRCENVPPARMFSGITSICELLLSA